MEREPIREHEAGQLAMCYAEEAILCQWRVKGLDSIVNHLLT